MGMEKTVTATIPNPVPPTAVVGSVIVIAAKNATATTIRARYHLPLKDFARLDASFWL
jgi:hypothetical protein